MNKQSLITLYIREIIGMLKKNNIFLVIFWIYISKKIIYYIIVLQIGVNVLAVTTLILKICIYSEINLYPNYSLMDNLKTKFILLINNNNKKEVLAFLVFAYTIIFILKISLRSIYLSIKIYNEIKWQFLVDKIFSYKKLYEVVFLEDNIEIKENIIIGFWGKKCVKINLFKNG